MGRLLAIDFGKKRIGIAVTDPLQMIATGLTTVLAHEFWPYLDKYLQAEKVERVVVGLPVQMNNQPSEAQQFVRQFMSTFVKRYPAIPLDTIDERFTSQMAMQTMIDGGLKKKDRQNKALVDTISATIILQDYMKVREHKKKLGES